MLNRTDFSLYQESCISITTVTISPVAFNFFQTNTLWQWVKRMPIVYIIYKSHYESENQENSCRCCMAVAGIR